MPPDPIARRDTAILPGEADYDAFSAAIMETARGRWFLAEHARRHRSASTEAAIEALRRIEDSLRETSPARHTDTLLEELRALAATIRGAKLDIAGADGEFSRGAKVMALLELLERRIVAMVADARADAAPSNAASRDDRTEAPRAHLTVVSVTAPAEVIRARVDLPAVDLGPAADVAEAVAVTAAEPAAPAVAESAVATEPTVEIAPDDMFVPFTFDEAGQALPEQPDAVANSNEPLPAAAIEKPAPLYDPLAPLLALSIEERIALVS